MLDFQISQSSVATQLRWGGSLYNRSIENFLRNLTVKELWKSVFICWSYGQKTKWLFFGTRCKSDEYRVNRCVQKQKSLKFAKNRASWFICFQDMSSQILVASFLGHSVHVDNNCSAGNTCSGWIVTVIMHKEGFVDKICFYVQTRQL